MADPDKPNQKVRGAAFVASLCSVRGLGPGHCRPCGGAFCHYSYLQELLESTQRSPEPVSHTGTWQ